MSYFSILLADNDEDILSSYSELLELEGYTVLQARNPEEAQAIIETQHIHLAIVDLRLRNDDDDKDKSGLTLVKESARALPKLIWTRYPEIQDVREALKSDQTEQPPAVDFVEKDVPVEQFLLAVKQAIAQHVRLNRDLAIRFGGHHSLSFLQLLQSIEPHLSEQLLNARLAELETLFRQLFYDSKQITVEDILIDQPEYTILRVYAFDSAGTESQYLVSYGQTARLEDKNRRFKTIIARRAGITNLNPNRRRETVHYAAIAYHFVGTHLDETMPLKEFHLHSPQETLSTIDHLYHIRLLYWHETQRKYNEAETITQFYLKWLQQEDKLASASHVTQCVADLCKHSLVGGLRLSEDEQYLSLRLPDGGQVNYPNPALYMDGERFTPNELVEWGMTHGHINMNTVLVDSVARTWLIDFSRVGEAPILHDFVSMETAVKLNLLNKLDLFTWYEMESYLLSLADLNSNADPAYFPENIAQVLSIITRIRQLATQFSGCDMPAYYKGLFFHAIDHISRYQAGIRYPRRTQLRYWHMLVSAALLCQKLLTPIITDVGLPSQAKEGLWVDNINKMAWVQGKRIDLTPQEFDILAYLYNHIGQLCERQAIVEQGLGEPYDPYDPEQSRLNSAMSRLRRKLEPDPQKPQYLTTVRGRGYMLTS